MALIATLLRKRLPLLLISIRTGVRHAMKDSPKLETVPTLGAMSVGVVRHHVTDGTAMVLPEASSTANADTTSGKDLEEQK